MIFSTGGSPKSSRLVCAAPSQISRSQADPPAIRAVSISLLLINSSLAIASKLVGFSLLPLPDGLLGLLA